MKSKLMIALVIALVCLPIVFADDYTYTATKDFDVYIDPEPYLDGKMYATVDITGAGGHIDHDHKCYSMVFINESGGAFKHVQSNPILASSSGISLRVGAVTPEELGYFTITEGMGQVYWRKFNQVAGARFLYVVKCTTDAETLVWESFEVPTYRELGKTLPGWGVWFVGQKYLGWVMFMVFLVIIIVFAIAKLVGRK